jgi:hypothetical protein
MKGGRASQATWHFQIGAILAHIVLVSGKEKIKEEG